MSEGIDLTYDGELALDMLSARIAELEKVNAILRASILHLQHQMAPDPAPPRQPDSSI